MYIVDTNVLILGIRKKDPDYSFLQKVILKQQLYLSCIAIGEYLSGATPEEETEIENLILNFTVLPVDLAVARLAGIYKKQFLKTKRIQLLDYFIAAQAKLHGLTLVTHNKADFPMKDIRIITPK